METKEKQRTEELERFAQELKETIRNSGRTNVIPIRILEELFVKYNIKLRKDQL